jgi:hypothetical protein
MKRYMYTSPGQLTLGRCFMDRHHATDYKQLSGVQGELWHDLTLIHPFSAHTYLDKSLLWFYRILYKSVMFPSLYRSLVSCGTYDLL